MKNGGSKSNKTVTSTPTKKGFAGLDPKEAQWQCQWAACPWAEAGKKNHAFRTRCGGCSIVKSEALRPPAKCRVTTQKGAPSVSLREEEAKKKAEESKKKAAAASETATRRVAAGAGNAQQTASATGSTAAHPPAVCTTPKSAPTSVSDRAADILQTAADRLRSNEKPTKKPLAFSAEQTERFEKLMPCLSPVIESLAEDYLLTPLSLPTSDETVMKWLADSKPCHRAKEKEDLELAVARLKGSMAALSAEEAELLKPRLESQEAALAKLGKEPTDVDSQLAGVAAAACKFQQAVSERKSRMNQAQDRTAARIASRKKFLLDLQDQLQFVIDATEELEQTHAQAHKERTEAHCTREAEVQVKFDGKLALLKVAQETLATDKAALATRGAMKVDRSQAVASGTEVKTTPEAQLLAFQEQMKSQLPEAAAVAARQQQEHMLQIQALQKQLEDNNAHMQRVAAQARLDKERQDAYEMRHEVDTTSLPALQMPQGEQFQKQSQLLCLLRAWNTANSSTPVLFRDVITHCDLGTDAPMFIRTALGTAWDKWFACGDPSEQSVIPRQALQLVLASLEKLCLVWESEESAKATQAAAAGSYALMAGDAKKRRAEVLDKALGLYVLCFWLAWSHGRCSAQASLGAMRLPTHAPRLPPGSTGLQSHATS